MSHFIEPPITRRAVVAGLAAAAGSTAIAAPARALTPRGASGSRAKGEFQQWQSLEARSFRVAAENGSCALSLVAVRALPAKGARPAACSRPHAFLAVFEAPAAASRPAGDRTYAVQHPQLGTFPLFLGVGDREAGKQRFVAVFN
ncbi:MAG: hypothetical protein QOE79_1497 [Sphingomonadales bacterium]|nr:hypothetical protein [Sphingomonadales bacterium]MEA3051047.1 hypothetical protein [Sphingomonadales bacterium]